MVQTKKVRSLLGSMQSLLDSEEVVSDTFLISVAQVLWESLDTPTSLGLFLCAKHGDLLSILNHEIDPRKYVDLGGFRDSYLAVSFLRKAPLAVVGIDRRATALLKFQQSESTCRDTNARIRSLRSGSKLCSPRVGAILHSAARKISQLLGKFDHGKWISACRFGPGVFNGARRRQTSIYDKLQVRPSVTPEFCGPGRILIQSSPCWSRSITGIEIEGFWPLISSSMLESIPGNRVEFVPKDAKTDRAIAIEPLINVYSQLGIGRMIREKLKFVGIDLDDQTRNQKLAELASRDGSLATIDLSSASDTVAKELVSMLLPEEWLHPMDCCRSKVGKLDGEWLYYEKFSSMGNGFTFELESLIFWALGLSVTEAYGFTSDTFSVYGDDIVVPTSTRGLMEEVLSYCGFSVNHRKTFWDSPFRESCGKDYFDGANVRPIFVREIPTNISGLFNLANRIRRHSHDRGDLFHSDHKLRDCWTAVVRVIPKSFLTHCVVPASAGDSTGLVTNWDEAQRSLFLKPYRKDRGWEGWQTLSISDIPMTQKVTNFLGGTAEMLYRCRNGFGDDFLPGLPRTSRGTRRRLRETTPFWEWTNLKPYTK